jgi:hypothetical protein
MINNLINFKIFGKNKALFKQIVVIFYWIVVIFDQTVVIYWPLCKQIFLIKNKEYLKKLSVFGHYLFQFDSNYLKTERILLILISYCLARFSLFSYNQNFANLIPSSLVLFIVPFVLFHLGLIRFWQDLLKFV